MKTRTVRTLVALLLLVVSTSVYAEVVAHLSQYDMEKQVNIYKNYIRLEGDVCQSSSIEIGQVLYLERSAPRTFVNEDGGGYVAKITVTGFEDEATRTVYSYTVEMDLQDEVDPAINLPETGVF